METKGKVQTVDDGTNVLVETTESSNQHYSHLNKLVEVLHVLTNDDVIEEWKLRDKTFEDELELATKWIRKQNGFASSNCYDESLNILGGSIVKYKLL